MTLIGSLRLHRGDRIARVDRALERVGGIHGGDVADLRDIQLRGDTRGDVLAVRGSRSEDMRVVLRDVQHGGFDVFREARFELRRVGQQHLGDACDLRRRVSRGLRVVTCDQHVDIAANSICAAATVFSVAAFSDALSCSAITRIVISLSSPYSTLASVFSFSTSVFTSATFTPAERFGGSTTFSVFRRGVTSTPRSSGLSVSSGFFFAFMMFGSVT